MSRTARQLSSTMNSDVASVGIKDALEAAFIWSVVYLKDVSTRMQLVGMKIVSIFFLFISKCILSPLNLPNNRLPF